MDGMPTPGMPGAGGAPPPPPMPSGPPQSLLRGPPGPGKSPMQSPGDGAGNRAAAFQLLKQITTAAYKVGMAFPVGSPEAQAISDAIKKFQSVVGKAEKTIPGQAGLIALASQAQKGPLSGAPPPGIAPTNTPPPGVEQPPPGMAGEEVNA